MICLVSTCKASQVIVGGAKVVLERGGLLYSRRRHTHTPVSKTLRVRSAAFGCGIANAINRADRDDILTDKRGRNPAIGHQAANNPDPQ